MALANCPRCGKLFADNFREVCPACIKQIDNEYQRCADYLRECKGATMSEVSEETGVSIKQITKFILEGRISVRNAPNMTYPCESCGAFIRENHICDNCRNRLIKDTQQMMREDNKKAEEMKAAYLSSKGEHRGLGATKGR